MTAKLERVTGIEPVYSAWKAAVLPLYYTRPTRPSEYPTSVAARPAQAFLCAHSTMLHAFITIMR